MDIIISTENAPQDIKKYINETFKPNEIFINGNAYSFDYKEIQIDFIFCEPEYFNANYHYFAFNDLGNLTGRLAHKIGLKYGQEGLWYNHYYNDMKVGRIQISTDFNKIFKFLDLDYNKWVKGFKTLEEIFEYVSESKFFNPIDYRLENLNKINRDRNKKRSTYITFLEYVENKGVNSKYDDKLNTHMRYNVPSVIEIAFPESNIKENINRMEMEIENKIKANNKFNGLIIMETFNIYDTELGKSIRNFKEYVTNYNTFESYEEYILNTDLNDIIETFKSVNKL